MKNIYYILLLLVIIIFSYFFMNMNNSVNEKQDIKNIDLSSYTNAYFAGGCFWCMEGIFESQDGVHEAVSGYMGGTEQTGNYNDVSTGETKHREIVKVVYNPEIITFNELIELYWRQIDPTDSEGQFADRGFQYTTAIYYNNDIEKKIAQESKDKLSSSGKFDSEIVTSILKSSDFYRAEESHQDYYKKQSLKYKAYKKGSGRADYIKNTWGGDLTDLKSKLTDIQYKVTQKNGTEKPFDNEYWDNKEEGIYVDLIDGTPLYSSLDKYKSGTGWPSFTKPISDGVLLEKADNTLFSKRTEIRGKKSDSHIGHVFNDGPDDKGGLRYCMNSAALKFIPVSELEEKGYGEYLELFK